MMTEGINEHQNKIHIDSMRGNKLEEKLHRITNKTLLEMSADTVLFFQGTQSLAAVQILKKVCRGKTEDFELICIKE